MCVKLGFRLICIVLGGLYGGFQVLCGRSGIGLGEVAV